MIIIHLHLQPQFKYELFHILHTISKLNYTSSEKQNVHSDQRSLSFRVGHFHRQLIGINMYITGIYRNQLRFERFANILINLGKQNGCF